MISKNDCMSILVKIEDEKGIDVNKYIKQLLVSREPPIDVLKFIAAQRGIEVANFYEVLRKSNNEKRSPLYKNIISEKAENIFVLLSSLLTQISLFAKKLNDPIRATAFYEQVRAEEITRALNNYYKKDSDNGASCLALLKLLRSDMLVLEYIAGKRELA